MLNLICVFCDMALYTRVWGNAMVDVSDRPSPQAPGVASGSVQLSQPSVR